jgi:hypothetical protein
MTLDCMCSQVHATATGWQGIVLTSELRTMDGIARGLHHDLVVLARPPRTLRNVTPVRVAIARWRRLQPYAARDPEPLAVGGHYAVTRSLVAGLKAIGADYAYEPDLRLCTARAAIVLCQRTSLLAAIQWKRRGGCELLFAGPNIVDRPHQQDGVVLSSEIDGLIVASRKMQDIFEREEPSLRGRVRVWPAGVDANYWQRSGQGSRACVLIYNKRMPDHAARLAALIGAHGYACKVLNYGDKRADKYRPSQFRALLDCAFACIFLSLDEPQGIAATEAWSMDVPTLSFVAENAARNTVPYQTLETGCYWSTFDELLQLLSRAKHGDFAPRAWVLEHMTDEICARQLLALTKD